MTSKFWNVLKLSPVVFAAIFFSGNSAFAAEKVTSVAELSQEANSIGQVNSVAQYKDVQPSDWAYQALTSLTERYGCISGYPDGTFRGQRTLTRYEFAAALNLCLDRVNELIATSTSGLATQEDLGILQRLQEDFSAELATLRGRVDKVEAKTAELESKQFSTTTKLSGEAVFNISDTLSEKKAGGGDIVDNTTFSDRIRLNFNSSFTGKDLLNVRINAINTEALGTAVTGTNMSRLSIDANSTTPGYNNSAAIDKVSYAFPVGKDIRVKLDAAGGEMYANVDNYNPLFASDSKGTISRYGRFSPIYRQAQGGAGATITYAPKKSPLSLSAAYFSNNANDPASEKGLTDGNYAGLVQLGYKFSDSFNLGLAYAKTQRVGGDNLFQGTGSKSANQPFGTATAKTDLQNYGVQATLKPSKKVTLAGWYGVAQADDLTSTKEADISYWAASLGFQDFLSKGNVLGFIVGQPPKVTGGTGVTKEADTSLHLETLYKVKVNNNVEVTPGLLVILNAENNNNNDPIYVGTVRTTFSF